jgi:hypothetical protein
MQNTLEMLGAKGDEKMLPDPVIPVEKLIPKRFPLDQIREA